MSAAVKTYTNPPIVEAMVEVHFTSGAPWSEASLERASAAVATRYPGARQRRNRLDIHAKVRGEDLSTEGAMIFHHALFASEDGRSLVGIGENRLTVHVLAPYPGWDRFFPKVTEALELYATAVRPDGVSLVGVRYIDQIGVPLTEDVALDDFFTCLPFRPLAMPSSLDAFHYLTQVHDVKDDFSAVLTIASVPTPADTPRPVVMYDLNLVRMFPAMPASIADVGRHAAFLHDRQKAIFEDSITDKMRELFA